MDVKSYFIVVSVNFSLITGEAEQLFKSILAIHGSFLNYLFFFFAYLYIDFSLLLFSGSSLNIPDINPLSVTYMSNIFSHIKTSLI